MAKIWRNRILAGTKRLSDCPNSYKDDVVGLIKADIESGKITAETLRSLVGGSITATEYEEMVGEAYVDG